MLSREFTILNSIGLHARPAAIFVQTANKYTSDITVEKCGKKVNGKSIMGIMSLGAANGESIVVSVDGSDEEKAMEELSNLLEDLKG